MGYGCTKAAMDRLTAIQAALLEQTDPDNPNQTVRYRQVLESIRRGGYPNPTSNTFCVPAKRPGAPGRYVGRMAFHEIGRENPDGAVTGTVWMAVDRFPRATAEPGVCGRVRQAGSFRIEPDGTVTRFPLVPRRFWTAERRPVSGQPEPAVI